MPETALQFGDFTLDRANLQVLHRGEPLPLTPKAFEVLRALASRAGQLVTKNELLDTLWPGVYVSESALVVCISEIRRTLGDPVGAARFIQTVHRRGYRFVAETVELELPAARASTGSALADLDAVAATDPGLVGREIELERLRELYRRSRTGARQVALLHGEPGIGKTRLLEAFLEAVREESRAEGGVVLRADGVRQVGPVEPYFPVLDAMAGEVRRADSGPLIECLRGLAPTWLARMPWLVGEREREDLARSVLGAPAGRMLREIVHALEVLAAARPVVLAVDDVQWADVATRDLVSALAHGREPARLLVIATSRSAPPEDRDHPLQQLRRALVPRRLCQEIALDRLPASAVDALLQRTFAVNAVPADLAWRLHDRTDGNPLVLVELVRHWLREGVLERDGATLRAGPVAVEAVSQLPETVRSLVDHQIEELTREERTILDAASVLGASFDTQTLGGMLDLPARRVETQLDHLERRCRLVDAAGFRRGADGVASASYSFAFPLVRDHLEQSLSELRFLRLHLAAARALEARMNAAHARAPDAPAGGDEPLHRLQARIGSHLVHAGDLAAALEHLEQAARVARAGGAPFDSIAVLDLALDATSRLPDVEPGGARPGTIELGLREARALALRSCGEFQRAADDYERAAAIAARLGATDREARAWLGRGNTLFLVDRPAAVESFARAERLAGAGASAAVTATIASQRAYASLRFRRWTRQASDAIRAAVELLREAGDRALLGPALARQSYFLGIECLLDEGLAATDEASAIALEEGDLFEYLLARQRRAWLLRTGGRPGESLAVSTAAGRLAAANAQPGWERIFQLEEASCALDVGAAAHARDLAGAVHERARAARHVLAEDQGRLVLGAARTALGELDAAAADLAAVRARFAAPDAPVEWALRTQLELATAELALAQGDLARVGSASRAAIELSEPPHDRAALARAHTFLARVALARGDAAASETALRQSLALVDATSLPHEEWRACAVLAELHAVCGRPGKARAHRERAAEVLDRVARSTLSHGDHAAELRDPLEAGLRSLRTRLL